MASSQLFAARASTMKRQATEHGRKRCRPAITMTADRQRCRDARPALRDQLVMDCKAASAAEAFSRRAHPDPDHGAADDVGKPSLAGGH